MYLSERTLFLSLRVHERLIVKPLIYSNDTFQISLRVVKIVVNVLVKQTEKWENTVLPTNTHSRKRGFGWNECWGVHWLISLFHP